MKKLAVVTGASRGLGREIRRHLQSNMNYAVLGISRTMPEPPDDIYTFYEDKISLSDLEGVKEARRRINLFGPIDLLVNNAGYFIYPPQAESTQDSYGLFLIHCLSIHHFLSNLNFNPGANIINIASVAGMKASPDMPMYGAMKAACISLTKSWAKIMASRGEGVRVNAIAPGFFKTDIAPEPLPDFLRETIPMKREGKPEEILPAIEMILRSEFMTGSVITLDGGEAA
jgi:3-oxoacyl-[acyl-carrier protein] reductase